jgi:hypothetical protein
MVFLLYINAASPPVSLTILPFCCHHVKIHYSPWIKENHPFAFCDQMTLQAKYLNTHQNILIYTVLANVLTFLLHLTPNAAQSSPTKRF